MSVFDDILKEEFAGLKKDLTEENIQARIRGLIFNGYI
jgi:NH3-dependent NAD+ synthetase